MRASYGKHMVAANTMNGGLADGKGSAMHLQVLPWEADSFAICLAYGCAAVLLVALAHCWRKRHAAARIQEAQRIRRYERESIARSLHDTYLQSVQGLMYSTHAALRTLPVDGSVRSDFEALLLRIGRVLTEGRDQLNVLRCAFISSHQFWESFVRDIELVEPRAGDRVRYDGVDDIDRLCGHLQHDLYAIAREAVMNALRHTNGMVSVHASAGSREFVLSIIDGGDGFGNFIDGKPGHHGIQGMRERSRLLGAKLELSDVPGRGARVRLALPATLAYRRRA